MRTYINTPQTITIGEIERKDFSLSSPQYKTLLIKNNNCLFVSDFLTRDLQRNDLGIEVGSLNYIKKSPKFFLRTKSLQKRSFLPEINSETAIPIKPKVFHQMDLKEDDLIISKDSNIGEIVILDQDYPQYMLSGALYRLPVKKETKYYLLAFIKHPIFREQLDFMVPKGATLRHAKTKFLDCKIPMPSTNKDNTIQYISLLVKAIISKEKLIKKRHLDILDTIEKELKDNQKAKKYTFEYPTIQQVKGTMRLDTGLYCHNFKYWNFLVQNYTHGSSNLIDRGFDWERGTSLESNNLKTRIDSDIYQKGFYELVLPTNISQYGTVHKTSYIGTPTKLKTIRRGDIIFGGEGFGKGRTFVVVEDVENIATNYHGIRLLNKKNDLAESIFIRCFLAFWRSKGIIDYIGVGGSGGHCAPAYFNLIETPLFPDKKTNDIVTLYHKKNQNYHISDSSMNNFTVRDSAFNEQAGIYELDKSAKQLKKRLNEVIDEIANGVNVLTTFDF